MEIYQDFVEFLRIFLDSFGKRAGFLGVIDPWEFYIFNAERSTRKAAQNKSDKVKISKT